MFYSAANVAAVQNACRIVDGISGNVSEKDGVDEAGEAQVAPYGSDHFIQHDSGDDESDEKYHSANEGDDRDEDPRVTILSAAQLELMFVKNAPDLSGSYTLY